MKLIPGDIFHATAQGISLSNAAEIFAAQRPYLYSSNASVVFGAALSAQCCALSHDNQWLAVGSSSSPRAHIYDAETGNLATTLADVPTGQVNGVDFNSTKTMLACAHATSPFITIYSISGTTFSKISNPSVLPAGTGNCCAFNPAGTLLAVGHATTPFITIYNTGDWSKVANPASLPVNSVTSCDFNHDGSLLALTRSGGGAALIVYNTSSWATVSLVTTPASIASPKCKFSPNGAYLAYFGSNLNRLYIYNTSTWETIPIADLGGNAGGLAWLDDSHIAVNANGLIKIINVATNTEISTHSSINSAGTNNHNEMICVPGSPRTLSGTVRDITETGLARRVSAIHAASGRVVCEVVSTAVTGIFSLRVWGNDKHNVICDGQSLEISQIIDAIPE